MAASQGVKIGRLKKTELEEADRIFRLAFGTFQQAHGYRAFAQGVAMQRPHVPGFNRADAYVIDDWR